jgi:ABC-type nitrate/sulfonate/bicarbonate transport system ATPase subunit
VPQGTLFPSANLKSTNRDTPAQLNSGCRRRVFIVRTAALAVHFSGHAANAQSL